MFMKKEYFPGLILLLPVFIFLSASCTQVQSSQENKIRQITDQVASDSVPAKKVLDTVAYNKFLSLVANNDTTGKWPAKGPYPLPDAILPFNRIVAFYGNLYSKRMGILGELPKKEMLKKLQEEVSKWQNADSSLPVLPALHYIAVTAQGSGGKDGKYRFRMPSSQIDTIINWAKEIKGLAFVDIQVGHSTVKDEVPVLEKYLQMPGVHLGIDPEFSLKNGEVPGTRIGAFNSEDINFAIDYLADIVRKNNLPPKILIVHRFTQGMVKGYEKIKKVPEVQVVMDMDGWGDKILKRSTYLRYIYKEPVQFTGFKLFYHNDTKTGADQLFTPSELLRFTPKPLYIQYQ